MSRVDDACHRITELHLRIIHRVSAENDYALVIHRGLAARENAAKDVPIALLRVADDREGRQRPAAHRVNIVQRIDCRNASVDLRIVRDRRKEIECLHQCNIVRKAKNTRIVACVKTDDHVLFRLDRKFAQNLSKIARREFSHSTGASNHFRQTLLHVIHLLFSIHQQLVNTVQVLGTVILDLDLAARAFAARDNLDVRIEPPHQLCLGGFDIRIY